MSESTQVSVQERYPDLHIKREHTLGIDKARQITDDWIASAETDYRMTCTLERTESSDLVTFNRTGVSGQFVSTPEKFELFAKLGFLFKSFKPKIEEQIERNLDEVIYKQSLK